MHREGSDGNNNDKRRSYMPPFPKVCVHPKLTSFSLVLGTIVSWCCAMSPSFQLFPGCGIIWIQELEVSLHDLARPLSKYPRDKLYLLPIWHSALDSKHNLIVAAVDLGVCQCRTKAGSWGDPTLAYASCLTAQLDKVYFNLWQNKLSNFCLLCWTLGSFT